MIPSTVIFSFYAGAAILLLCVIYSLVKIKEWPPALYIQYNGSTDTQTDTGNRPAREIQHAETPGQGAIDFLDRGISTVLLLVLIPVHVDLYQRHHSPKTPSIALRRTLIKGITYTGDDGQPHTMTDKYILIGDSTVILAHGKATVAGMDYAGRFIPATSIVAGSDTIVWNSMITSSKGVARYGFGTPIKSRRTGDSQRHRYRRSLGRDNPA